MNFKLKKINFIKSSYLATISLFIATSIYSFSLDKFVYKKMKTSGTLVPASIIGSYISTISHLYLYRKTDNEDCRKADYIKRATNFLTLSGFNIMGTALFIGGKIYKFKRCYIVFPIALIPWLTDIYGAYSLSKSNISNSF